MKCTIPGRGIRAFGKAIHCLAKIGDELYIEALQNGLALKTVNNARSAYACFLFQRGFFHSYSDGREKAKDGEESLKCRITIKSCVSVFKALSTLEKTVDHCRLQLDLQENKLVFVFHCKHGITKTHNLGFQECEALQAVFTKELCPNHISVPAKVLSEVVTNFPNSLEEVTLLAQPEGVQLKNYVEEDSIDGTRVPFTEISLAPAEFDDYQIGVDASVTFCLKELRAVLLFTDAINHNLSLRFETAGKPIVFSIDDNRDYQANFVLATLLDASMPSQSQLSTAQTCSTTANEKRTHTHNGHHSQSIDEATVLGGQCSRLDEDTMEQGVSSDVNLADAGRIADDFETGKDKPSSSRRKVLNTDVESGISRALHVATPPDPSLLEQSPPTCRTNPAGHSRNEGTVRAREAAVHSAQDYDPVDALFEVEQLLEDDMEVDFGEAPPSDFAKHSVVDPELKSHDLKHTGVRKRQMSKTANTSLPDDEFYCDDFPYQDMFTKRAPSQCPGPHQHKDQDLTQGEPGTTQESVINDSGFIPSTPPSKKFKSFLFGVGMFSDLNQSEVLAPDSEDED